VLNEVAKDVTVVGDVAQTASDGYSWELAHNYLSTTAIQATLLVGTGDILAQAIETDGFSRKGGAEAYDAARTARMAMLGLIIAGFGTATWLRFLESQLPGHATWQRVVEKSTIDACIWAPIANTLYLVLVPLLEGKSPDEVGELLKEKIVPVMKTELCTFFPYNLISFSLIPPLVRPFTTGFVSMCFAVYMSWITHQQEGSEAAAAPVPLTATGPRVGPPRMDMPDGELDDDDAAPEAAAAEPPSPRSNVLPIVTAAKTRQKA
jgi:protein Mpv17